MRPDPSAALAKFAVSGQMYARALSNAAQRSGGRVAPQILSGMAAQPRAQASSFLSGAARTPGAIPSANPGLAQVTNQYQFAHPDRLPHDFHDPHGTLDVNALASAEKAHARQQVGRFDQALQNTGRVQQQPGGTAALNQQIRQQYGSTDHDMFYDIINKGKGGPAAHAQTMQAPTPIEPTSLAGAGLDHSTSIGRRGSRPGALKVGVDAALAQFGKVAGPLERLLATEKSLGAGGARDFYKWQQGRGAMAPAAAPKPAMMPPSAAAPKVMLDPGYAREISLRR